MTNTGDCNTGNRNTSGRNTGSCNTGSWNTGNWNTGNCNTGNCNTGSWNTGNCNTGNCNTGSWNTGNWNTGNWNTGNCNTGSWNTGSWNTGYCNSITPDDCLVFNKPLKRSIWEEAQKPSWMFVNLTEWVNEKDMTDEEKQAYPSYVTTGGYLRYHADLRAAYIKAWEKASPEDRALTEKLPNFDPVVFEEVFGFNPFKKHPKEIIVDGQTYVLKDAVK